MKKTFNLFVSVYLLFTMGTIAQNKSGKEILYVGTYSSRGSEGIYVFEFDRSNGTLKQIQTIVDKKSPIFVELHPSGKYLYSANVGGLEEDTTSGSFSSFTIDQKSGKLSFLNHFNSMGVEPCHITIDKSGRTAYVSNYGGGSVAVFPLNKNGKIEASTDLKKFSGSSVHEERQEAAHIHSANLSPDEKFLYAVDLGTDKVNIFKVDGAKGTLEPTSKSSVQVKPGSGPRHFVFHPNGKFAYTSEELTSTIGMFSFDKTNGNLEIIKDSIKTLPDNFMEENYSADIDIEPTGKFLFMSNRGANTVAVFSIDDAGNLNLIGNESTQGNWPRGFWVDKKGDYLLVANQKSDDISVFKYDNKTGKITFTGTQVKVPSPVSLKVFKLK